MSSIRTAMPPVSCPSRSSRPSSTCRAAARSPSESAAQTHTTSSLPSPDSPDTSPPPPRLGSRVPSSRSTKDSGPRLDATSRGAEPDGAMVGTFPPRGWIKQLGRRRLADVGRDSRRRRVPRAPRRRCTTTGPGSAATTRPRRVRRAGASPARGSRRTARRAAPRARSSSGRPASVSSSIRISTTLPSVNAGAGTPSRSCLCEQQPVRPAGHPGPTGQRGQQTQRRRQVDDVEPPAAPASDASHALHAGRLRRLRARTSLSRRVGRRPTVVGTTEDRSSRGAEGTARRSPGNRTIRCARAQADSSRCQLRPGASRHRDR